MNVMKMNVMRTKGAILLLAGIAVFTFSGERVYASCGAAPIQHGIFGTTSFQNCGTSPVAFAWTHGRGVQRVLASLTTNTGTLAGHDSGANQTPSDAMMLPGAAPGQWFGQTDFSNPGWNGCTYVIQDDTAASPCTGGINPGALDYAIAGIDGLFPNVARLAAVSVDFNEFFSAHVLDQAGAPAGDGDPCFGDAFQANPVDVSCLPIPPPDLTGVVPLSCSSTGCTMTYDFPNVTALKNNSILDDCNVAEDAARSGAPSECVGGLGGTRNLYQGRVLVFKRGACTPATAAAFDRRAWIYPAAPASGTLPVNANFTVFSHEDANLNGVLDVGEDGTNGGAVNSRLDPFVAGFTKLPPTPPGADPTGGTGDLIGEHVRIPSITGATDCMFLGLGILLDEGGGCINPTTCTIFGEKVVSPLVSLDTNPIRIGSATPITDLVTTITATKLPQGKGKVDWSTGIEMTTSGFNVIGTKKGGGEVKINASLIEAREGTTGKGASYTVTFDPGQLKGSSSVYVEIVKTNGSKERFGPASF